MSGARAAYGTARYAYAMPCPVLAECMTPHGPTPMLCHIRYSRTGWYCTSLPGCYALIRYSPSVRHHKWLRDVRHWHTVWWSYLRVCAAMPALTLHNVL
eukprot:2680738-Rhodomonas_salina.3